MSFCTKCGEQNTNNTPFCAKCGAPAQNTGGVQPSQPNQPVQSTPQSQPNTNKPQKPDNFLVWGILTTLLCCLPFGIVSIVYASKVDNLYINGQYEDAKKAASNAKVWAIVSAASGLVFALIYLIVMV